MIDYKYSFLILNLLLLPFWLILFLKRKDLRREMITVGLVLAIIAPIYEHLYFIKDYWHPEFIIGTTTFGLEDFLFGFLSGGIVSSIYEEILGKRFAKRKDRSHHWLLITGFIIALSIILIHIAITGYSINSMYISVFILLFFSFLLIVIYRRDLLIDAFISGFSFSLVYLAIFFVMTALFPDWVTKFWKLHNLSNIYLFNIPIEEILWAFSWGFVGGPFYEFMMGLKLTKLSSQKV